MKRASITGLIGVILVALGIRSPLPNPPTADHTDHFAIYVAGKGLNSHPGVPTSECTGPQASACAMARGVYAGYKSSLFEKFRTFVDYKEVDDRGDANEAVALARRLGDDAHVLAVIGHSYSKTTTPAAKIYEEVQIPLLIPIATSPDVGYKVPWSLAPSQSDANVHMQNVFRLIPSDRIGQAPSIGYIVGKLIASGAVKNQAVLMDTSDNEEYAESLGEELRQKLPTSEIGRIKKDCKDEKSLPPSCFDWGKDHLLTPQYPPELLIYIGTEWSTNRFLINSIMAQGAAFSKLRYLLMTDGAKNVKPELVQQSAKTGVVILLTFPTKQISVDTLSINKDDAPLKEVLARLPNGGQSYEEYGFDSMILMSKALGRLIDADTPISRGTVIKELNQIPVMRGASTLFIFHQGENIHPDYSIYGAGGTQQMAFVQDSVCRGLNKAKYDGQGKGLQYLCYVGFDDVSQSRPQ